MVSHRLTPLSTETESRSPGGQDRAGLFRRLPFSGHSFVELLELRATDQPADIAYTFLRDGEIESEQFTWGELQQRSQMVGAQLQASVAVGDRALLLYPPGLEFVAAFFGCLAAGVIAVPLPVPQNDRDTAAIARLRAIAVDATPAAVLTTAAFLAEWEAGTGSTCRPARHDQPRTNLPGSLRCRWIATDVLPSDGLAVFRPTRPAASDLAFLQYTSGSTASPKGVMVSHANLLHNLTTAFALSRDASLNPSVSWLPVTHDLGLIEGVLQPAFRGHPAYLMSPAAFLQRPVRWLAAMTKYRASRSGGPNVAYDLCVRRVPPEAHQGLDLSAWQDAYNGAEPIRPETLASFAAAFADCGFRPDAFRLCYGLAEATLVVAAGGWHGSSASPVSCGTTAEGTAVAIVDPDTGCPCPDGQTGEIWIRGASVALGYWNRAEETARTFGACTTDGRGGFLRSGDLGYMCRGDLYVTGRLKDILIVRGSKHFPQDLEYTAESAHIGVRRGCVAAVSLCSGVDGDLVAILAEVDPRRMGEGAEAGDVARSIRGAICETHGVLPHVIALLLPGALPRTTSGKLQRFLCRDGWLARTLPVIEGASV